MLGRQFRWGKDEPQKTLEINLEIQQSPAFEHSPLVLVTTTRAEVHRNLEGPLAPDDFGVLHDLKSEGFTDYLCAPLPFISGETHAVTFATRAPGGFGETHLATIRRILRPLSRVAEIFALRRVATNLLSTYVGHDCGDRILKGRIMRGDVGQARQARRRLRGVRPACARPARRPRHLRIERRAGRAASLRARGDCAAVAAMKIQVRWVHKT